MKLKEFLYRLHRSDSISKEETKEMQQTVSSVPYLAELDTQKMLPQDSYSDINLQLQTSAHLEYVSNLDDSDILMPVLPEPTIEYVAPDKSQESNSYNAEYTPENSNGSIIVLSAKKDSNIEKSKKDLYQVEESDFVKYLSTLPPCIIPIEKYLVEVSEVNAIENNLKAAPDIHQETDELIKSSLDLNQGISSESLANLWAKQGRPDLAIQMYEKLAVEYPEKSATFAVKIEKLKTDNSL